MKAGHEIKWRVSYHPRHANVMVSPSRYSHRVLNLGSNQRKGGLETKHNGQVSANSRRKIRTAIDWLIEAADEKLLYSKKHKSFYKWKINFATLTLPTQGELDDKQVKRIVNAWLQYAKYAFGLRSYIWKAEPQKRGVIHIHITSDCFMWHKTVRQSWNKLLRKYQLLNGHEDPNSTDIHSTYKVKNMAAYLCKYFTKADSDGRVIGGRLWSCSRTLSNARGIRFEMNTEEMRGESAYLADEAEFVNQRDYCTSYYLTNGHLARLGECRLRDIYRARCKLIRKPEVKNQYEIWSIDGQDLSMDSRIQAAGKKFLSQSK